MNKTKVNIASWNIAERGNIDDPSGLEYRRVLTRLFVEPVNTLTSFEVTLII
jgi:hypothetical protein